MRVPVASLRPAVWPTAIALALRLGLALVAPLEPQWDGVIYERAAVELAEGHGYTRRVLDPSNEAEPSAFYPVGFPAVLSVLRRLGGDRRSDLVFQAFVGAAVVPVAYLLGRRSGGRRVGRIAAWLVALWPGGVLLSASWLAEPLVTLAIGLGLLPLAYARRRHRGRALAIAGLIAGLGAYLRVTTLAIAPVCAALVVLGPRLDRRALGRALLAVVVTIACGLLPLVPWMARNARLLGAPVLVSTNGGANLLLGTLGDGSFQPIPPELDCPRTMPEVERDACRRARAVARLREDPVGWLARGLGKLSHTFGHESAPAQSLGFALAASGHPRPSLALAMLSTERLFWTGFFGLALGGLLTLSRRRATSIAVLVGPLVGLALLHVLTIGGDRYHPVVVPSLAALAALAIDRLAGRRVSRSPERNR